MMLFVRCRMIVGTFALAVALLGTSSIARADEPFIAKLTLDSLSFVSFDGSDSLWLPAGSSLTMRFSNIDPAASLSFTVAPGDFQFEPVSVPGDARRLVYHLVSPATGSLTETTDGRRLEFNAQVAVSFEGGDADATGIYPMHFTTETATATDAQSGSQVSVTGLRVIDNVWYTQIVGATTNAGNAERAPGAAVYTVLSGQFDQLPDM